jgi:HAD superfamily hydrolase (TIGR01509 family)
MSLHPLFGRAAAVIFDFDDVLVDSEPLHEAAIKAVATERGWTMTHEHFLQMVGKGDEHAFRLLARENGHGLTDAAVAAMCEAKHLRCIDLIGERRFTVQPGAAALVDLVAGSRAAAVCSGSRREVVRGMLDASGLGRYMRTVITHEDVTHAKPAPDGYLLAASRVGAEPRTCVVIEDSPTGIRAGKAAGMFVIGVCHSFAAEKLYEADVVLPHIKALLAP